MADNHLCASSSILLPSNKFVISADEVSELVKQHGSIEAIMVLLIPSASQQSRPGISNYHVGAVALGGSGAIYIGANLEFKHGPLFQSVHAEQFVFVNALSHGETSLSMLVVSAAPCGHCRQFYSELNCADSITFMFRSGGDFTKFSLSQLLPGRFTPADLLPGDKLTLLMEPQNNPIEFDESAEASLAARKGDANFQKAASRALQEAVQAYAPYTRCPSGIALISTAGAVSGGRYVESAAYNPSLPPLQAAVINGIINHLGDYSEIQEAVLVELGDSMVRHDDTVRLVLSKIAPSAQVSVLHVQWTDSATTHCNGKL